MQVRMCSKHGHNERLYNLLSVVYRIHPSPANVQGEGGPVIRSEGHHTFTTLSLSLANTTFSPTYPHHDDNRRDADESDFHHRIGPLSSHVFANGVEPIAVAADDDDRSK